MDATVFSQGRGIWHVNASPTMRSLGELLMDSDKIVTIFPDSGSRYLTESFWSTSASGAGVDRSAEVGERA